MNDNFFALLISILSLIFTFWTLIRGRKNREVDMLHQCYNRLQAASANKPFATISEQIEMEDNPDDPRWEAYKLKSEDAQNDLDRELEFACYLVVNKQIDLEIFFYLFRGWLAGREMFWRNEKFKARAMNHPYTVQVIEMCNRKRLLPIKENVRLLKLNRAVERFISPDK